MVGAMRDLQIDEDWEFQRREWRMERAGWVGLALFVIAAGAGAFGDGPLSHATASDESGQLVVQYERFVRASAPSELRIQIRSATTGSGEVAFWTDLSYLRDLELSAILPEPKRVEQQGPRILYVFSVMDAAELHEVAFRYEPTRAGRLYGRFGVSDGSAAAVRQFAFF